MSPLVSPSRRYYVRLDEDGVHRPYEGIPPRSPRVVFVDTSLRNVFRTAELMSESRFTDEHRKRLRIFALDNKIRSRRFLSYIRTRPCLFHRDRPAEPHHIFGSTFATKGSSKSSDIFTVPVCRDCHEHFEANPRENTDLMLFWMMMAHDYILGTLQSIVEEEEEGKEKKT